MGGREVERHPAINLVVYLSALRRGELPELQEDNFPGFEGAWIPCRRWTTFGGHPVSDAFLNPAFLFPSDRSRFEARYVALRYEHQKADNQFVLSAQWLLWYDDILKHCTLDPYTRRELLLQKARAQEDRDAKHKVVQEFVQLLKTAKHDLPT